MLMLMMIIIIIFISDLLLLLKENIISYPMVERTNVIGIDIINFYIFN